jgi:hypothetical protein
MTYRLCISLILVLYLNYETLAGVFHGIDVNFFNCQQYSNWEVDYSPDSVAQNSKLVQEWIHAFQHNPIRCAKGRSLDLLTYGLSNSYKFSIICLANAFVTGRVYRPMQNYVWANLPDMCTLNVPYLDCYFEEVSNCGLPPRNISSSIHVEPNNLDDMKTALGKIMFPAGSYKDESPPSPTICQLAKATKKSMAWIAGEMLNYIIRPIPSIRTAVDARKKLVFSSVDRTKYSTIAVHDRGEFESAR